MYFTVKAPRHGLPNTIEKKDLNDFQSNVIEIQDPVNIDQFSLLIFQCQFSNWEHVELLF